MVGLFSCLVFSVCECMHVCVCVCVCLLDYASCLAFLLCFSILCVFVSCISCVRLHLCEINYIYECTVILVITE